MESLPQRDLENIKSRLIVLRNVPVLLDRDIAKIYGVETRDINKALKNNPEKFPDGYVFELDNNELKELRDNFPASFISSKSRALPKAFTEKGLYMLATIIKSPIATQATIEIVETFASVKDLQRNLIAFHNEKNPERQRTLISRFSSCLSDIVLPELQPDETETSIELNFLIGKIKHTVKRKRSNYGPDVVEEPESPYNLTTASDKEVEFSLG